MGKFDEIRKIMKEFKGDMDSLASNKINEEQTARARLNPTALEEELTSLAAEYDGHFKSTRNRYKERLNEAIADRRKGNSNKYATGYIDYDLLNKLNIISQSGVELTELELADFCKKLAAVKNGNGTLYVRRKRAAKLLPFLYQTIGKKEYRWQEKNEQTTGAVY